MFQPHCQDFDVFDEHEPGDKDLKAICVFIVLLCCNSTKPCDLQTSYSSFRSGTGGQGWWYLDTQEGIEKGMG